MNGHGHCLTRNLIFNLGSGSHNSREGDIYISYPFTHQVDVISHQPMDSSRRTVKLAITSLNFPHRYVIFLLRKVGWHNLSAPFSAITKLIISYLTVDLKGMRGADLIE